jgi:hypothetical protein
MISQDDSIVKDNNSFGLSENEYNEYIKELNKRFMDSVSSKS